MRISKELARAELERRKRLVADNDRLRRELYVLREKRPVTEVQARSIAVVVLRAGPMLCRHCGTFTAVPSISESPFDDQIRIVYACHGGRDFRVVDQVASMVGAREVLRALVEPVFDPPSWFEIAANDRRRSIPEVYR
jgi:hypothetical protein